MIQNKINNLKENQNLKLFLSLIGWYLIPSIYMLIRMNIFSFSEVNLNILGQLEWFDLIDEILVVSLTLPIYSLFKKGDYNSKKSLYLLVISFFIYFLFTIIVSFFISNISEFMNAQNASEYLRLQSFSLLINYISSFIIILYIVNEKDKFINYFTIAKIMLLILSDIVFINLYKENGAAYSEFIINTIISFLFIILSFKDNLLYSKIFNKDEKEENVHLINLLIEYIKIGVFGGFQIFIDNFIYAIMICKMVNAVNESGNYWVANNFIWGWLLVPGICYGEIIRKNKNNKFDLKFSFKITFLIMMIWLISSPFWSWFLTNGMKVDAIMVLSIVVPLIPFYIFYLLSLFIDSWFISKGKLYYNFINSVLCNFVYYGIAYILFNKGIFELNMMFIIYLFGFGNIFHFVISLLLYKYEGYRYQKINKIA